MTRIQDGQYLETTMNTILKLALAATLVTAVPVTSHAQSSAPAALSQSGPSQAKINAKVTQRAKATAMRKRLNAQDRKQKRFATAKTDRNARTTANRASSKSRRDALVTSLKFESGRNENLLNESGLNARQTRLKSKLTKVKVNREAKRIESLRAANKKRIESKRNAVARNPVK